MINIEDVSRQKYESIVIDSYHIYGSAAFNEINEGKADQVYYLLFKDSKYRLAIIGGVVDNEFISPFSAPFGGFIYLHNDIRLQIIEEAIDLLFEWAKKKAFNSIKITLPPSFYNESYTSKLINVFYRKGFPTEKIELNYHFITSKFNSHYSELIWRNAKKNLNISFNKNLLFEECLSIDNKKIAYAIIKLNRETKGKPLKMSFEELLKTSLVVQSNFFLVKDTDNNHIASAIVFIVSKGIAQVIYWGDNPSYSNLKTMNFLSYKVFEYYKEAGIKIVDIGYSTVDSIPNYGLCEFKESLGCNINTKYSFVKFI